MVPRVKFSYDWSMYARLREKYPVNDEFLLQESEILSFSALSNTTICRPMDKSGSTHPDGTTGEELLMFPG